MNPADDAAAPTTQENETPTITAPEGIDLDAINEAIAESEKSPELQNSFDVKDINLDNTPTSDAELQAQMKEDPNMSLAGGSNESADTATTAAAATTATDVADIADDAPISAPEVAAEPEHTAPVAGFVDGDIVDDPEAPAPAAEETPDYAAREADPVESFDENAAPAPVADAATPESNDASATQTDDKKDKKTAKAAAKKSIDFDAILHNNIAIAGIVAGGIVILLVVIIVLALN